MKVEYGNWKIEEDGKVFLKVIDFPVDEDCGFGGESMWVIRVDGDDMNGTGTLANQPAFSDLQYGTLIRYGGGTLDTKPKFIETLPHK